MPDVSFTTLIPSTGDSERILLAKLRAPCTSGTALASAARTVTTLSSTLGSRGYKGIIVYVNVTAASGTGGLTTRLVGVDPLSGVTALNAAVVGAITATGLRIYHFGPGVGPLSNAGLGGSAAGVYLGSQFQIQVIHGDTSSYTYSVSYELIP